VYSIHHICYIGKRTWPQRYVEVSRHHDNTDPYSWRTPEPNTSVKKMSVHHNKAFSFGSQHLRRFPLILSLSLRAKRSNLVINVLCIKDCFVVCAPCPVKLPLFNRASNDIGQGQGSPELSCHCDPLDIFFINYCNCISITIYDGKGWYL